MIRLLQKHELKIAISCMGVLLLTGCNRSDKLDPTSPAAEKSASLPTTTAMEKAVDVPPTLISLVTKATKAKQARHDAAIDPAKDGWDSEVIGDACQKQLTLLLNQTLTPPLDHNHANVLGAGFATTALRPSKPNEKILPGNLVIRKGKVNSATSLDWQTASSELFSRVSEIGEPHVHVKVVRIQRGEATKATTRCFIEVSAIGDEGTIEQHLEWTCDWTEVTSTPKLQYISAVSFQETQSKGRWFADRTLEVFGDDPSYRDQLQFGLNHWLSRIEVTHGMYVFAEYGVAVGDVNNDGLEDVYICQPGGLPNRLLIHQADGSVRDGAQDAGVDWLDHTSSALFVDFDNDGDQDLAIALESRRVLLLQNDGTGSFQLAQELNIEDRHVQGLCAADFDNDSLVDLYLTVAFADEQARPDEKRPKFSYHDANEGGANVLFRNKTIAGRLQFQNVTREVGLDVNNRRHSLAAAWEDFDNDGDQDLYVANDYGQNCLYRNDHGLFTEIAPAVGAVDFGSGMSVSWSDFDRDGWMDLYVGNMFSSAGNRITRQDEFRPSSDKQLRRVLSRFAKGNTLFRNEQGRGFVEPTSATDVQMGRWAWSSPFVDLNNDGWTDMFVANGYVTGDDERDL